MPSPFQRLLLAVLLAAVLFSVTVVVEAAPQACCAPASRADGSCHDQAEGVKERPGMCLTCLLGQGLKLEPPAQAAYPVAISERAGGFAAEKPLDLAFDILRPPISG